MSSLTPRVGFYMPADDGSEPINVATDLNDNLEKLDSSIGFVPSTSSALPATPFQGMARHETDTNRAYFWQAGFWRQVLTAGATFLSNIILNSGSKLGLGNAAPVAMVDISVANAGTQTGMRLKQDGDTFPRLELNSNNLKWGSGTATQDVTLSRTGAGNLTISNSVSIANTLSVTGDTMMSNVDISGNLSVGGSIINDLVVTGDFSATGTGFVTIVRKLNDTARINTSAISNDPDLFYALEANSSYFVELMLAYAGGPTGDLRTAWSYPTGSGGYKWALGEAQTGTDRDATSMRTGVHSPITEVIYGATTTSLSNGALEILVVTTSSTAGNLHFRWAQGSQNNVDATTVKANCIMQIRKLA